MLRLIFSAVALAFTPAIAACQSVQETQEPGWVSGRVVDVNGNPISAVLSIGDERFAVDSDGSFAVTPFAALVYKIEVEADGFYSMRHTFSHAELMQGTKIGDIVLVARKSGRTLFVFGGDTMIGRRFYDPFEGEPVLVHPGTRLEDSKLLLAEMKPYLERADYASVNLETPIFETPPSEPAPKFVTFYSAPETLKALEWAGIDYVALGNNHTYDFLEPGLDVTLAHLRESQLDYSGAGKNEAEALKAHRHQAGPFAFDFLSYVGWSAGPTSQSAEVDKGGAALGSIDNILSSVRASVANEGTPILQFHGGLEYVEEPTLSIETKLKQAADNGAALVIGHHPHVVQGLELYQGKLIAWSLGNFLFDQYFYAAQSAALLYVWMDGNEFHHAEAVPVYIKGYHPTPAVGAMRDAINQRLFDLSAKRETRITRSGGHMILSKSVSPPQPQPNFSAAIDCHAGMARTGQDLLVRGDFDTHTLFEAPDRSWLDSDERIGIRASQEQPWNNKLYIDLPEQQSITTGMRKFQRVFTPGTPMSVRADVSSTAEVQIDVYLQIRATRQGLQDALQNGRKVLVGSVTLEAAESIQLDLDFDSPRTRARSIRVLFDVHSKDAQARFKLDNLQFIEWKTPFMPSTRFCSVDKPKSISSRP